MLFHSITSFLGIKDKHVEVFNSGEKEDRFWFELHTRVRKRKCPKCKKRTKRVHGYRWQSIQGVLDRVLFNQKIRKITNQGYSLTKGGYQTGFSCISVPFLINIAKLLQLSQLWG